MLFNVKSALAEPRLTILPTGTLVALNQLLLAKTITPETSPHRSVRRMLERQRRPERAPR